MKNILYTLFVLLFSQIVIAQQDAETEKIILKFKSQFEQLQGFSADVSLTIDNKQENVFTTYSGEFKLKQEKYYINISEYEIFSDGKSRWVYMADVDEVTVSTIEDEEDLLNNPFQILNNFKERFKYKLQNEIQDEGETVYVIELYPFDLDQPYHTISLRIGKKSLLLKSARYLSKNGIHYLIDLNNIQTETLNDSDFVFNINEHPDAEIIDLR